MKKFWIIFLVLLLVCAGVIMTSCSPSEPDTVSPSPRIEDVDYLLKDGKITISLSSISVTNNGEYDVILDIAELDDDLLGCHFKGSLFYVSDGTRYLLSGALDAFPNVVAQFPRKYRWTFKAGEFGEDGNAESAAKGGYTLPTDGNVPNGAKLEFLLTAMTPKWKYFGDNDAESYNFIPEKSGSSATAKTEAIDYKKSGIECGIKEGSPLVFRAKPDVTLVAGDTVLSNGGSDKNDTGHGNIEEAEWEKVKNAPTDSILRFNCTVKVGAVGSNSREPGWGFGGVGGNVNGEFPKVREQNQELTLVIPKGMSAGDQTFNIDILAEDILLSSNEHWSFVRTNSTYTSEQKINSITIYTPQP
jgi:hypothetical protein